MFLILFMIGCVHATTVQYDVFYGRPVAEEDLERMVELNITNWCIIDIDLPCDPKEGRRVDGKCNNLHYPWKGTQHTTLRRMLPPDYNPGFEVRKAKSGNDLPPPRNVRTALLPEGDIPDQDLSHLASFFFVFFIHDFLSIHDTLNYVVERTYCCQERGQYDAQLFKTWCAPIKVPDDDPVHRFSNIRCLNLTKPITYQNMECVADKNTVPSRLLQTTPFYDLSHVYGLQQGLPAYRTFKDGLLKYVIEEGRIWPPSLKDGSAVCLSNQPPAETACHDMPGEGANSIVGDALFTVWAWRYHNKVASELSKINPCWSDEKLFETAKDITISVIVQIGFYEFFPLFMGRDNLVEDGVISATPGFRDIYDKNMIPENFFEFLLATRWVHTIQPGKLRLSDADGHYLNQIPVVNLTFRTGFLHIDNNVDYITQGSFRDPNAKVDHIVDSDIAETILGALQLASDVTSSDLAKDRLFGSPPYIKYRDMCTGCSHTSFDDLADIMAPERLEMLRNRYENIEDVELTSALWLEEMVEGGYVPVSFYCIVMKQLLAIVKFDRHWYERPNRPNAFTYAQLQEIRKATVAHVLCEVGDTVTKIQPHAFLRNKKGNKIESCNKIPKLNLNAWKDIKCYMK